MHSRGSRGHQTAEQSTKHFFVSLLSQLRNSSLNNVPLSYSIQNFFDMVNEQWNKASLQAAVSGVINIGDMYAESSFSPPSQLTHSTKSFPDLKQSFVSHLAGLLHIQYSGFAQLQRSDFRNKHGIVHFLQHPGLYNSNGFSDLVSVQHANLVSPR